MKYVCWLGLLCMVLSPIPYPQSQYPRREIKERSFVHRHLPTELDSVALLDIMLMKNMKKEKIKPIYLLIFVLMGEV